MAPAHCFVDLSVATPPVAGRVCQWCVGEVDPPRAPVWPAPGCVRERWGGGGGPLFFGALRCVWRPRCARSVLRRGVLTTF